MASSSSSINIIPHIKYDVFLSFRGKDVRHHFISHLNAALCRKKIVTFIDDKLNKGDEISPSFSSAIEGSMISIVIFSKGYASSRWCLNELVKILESKNKYGQIVVPVFYRVDPSDVRNQTGTFGDSFSKLEERFKEKIDMLQKWRIAMKEAANLSGFDSHDFRYDSVLIEGIVNHILKKLKDLFPSDNKHQLVGVESVIKEIESLLMTGSIDFNTVGIWGIGGIGKTAIASAIYRNISSHFEGSYFMQNIREESEKPGGLASFRRELVSTLLDDGNVSIGTPNIGLSFASKRLSRKKVLIIFDDVTCMQQIELLIGGLDRLDCFMPGSRIIVTTRDAQLLKNLPGSRVGNVFKVKELSYNDSLTLFSRNAFGQNLPPTSYLELSNIVIKYANGVPLALKVLGRYLFGRSEEEWESAIKKLSRIPHMDIQKVLKVSYNSLDDEEQNIFLDIACFFKGQHQDLVMNFLGACGFSAKIGICVLVDKSLVTISNNKITMHDLLQEMGREIVRQESIKDPGKRSRLWHHEDIYQVLNKNTNLAALKRLNLTYSKKLSRVPDLSLALNLEELNLAGCTNLIDIHSSIQHLNKLVILDLRFCFSLKSLPTGINLDSLKKLFLQQCSNFERFPEISCNIEQLDLVGTAIEELPSSIGNLSRLVTLDLRKCSRLKRVSSSLCNLKSLESLYLSGCLKLGKLPEEIGNLGSLKNMLANETAISQVPSSIACLNRVELLSVAGCEGRPPQMGLKLPILFQSQILENLSLINCSITELPESLGQLPSLKYLNLEENNFEKIPSNIKQVSKLSLLILDNCKRLQSLPELPCRSSVYARHCTSLETLSNLSTLFKPLCQKFDFCNCFKLNRNEVRQIVEEALKKIQVLATWWKEQDLEDDHNPPRGSIWYPGSEIPEWFSFQSMGSSITPELPPGWFNNNFVGFALCAIVPEYRGDTQDLLVDCEFKLKTKDGDWHFATYLLSVWNEDFGVTSSLESDHVLLGYDFSMYSDGFGGSNKACIQFYIRNYMDKRIEGFDVKKCGAHLIYSQDPRKRLRSEVEDDQVLHPKRLKYSLNRLHER